MAAVIYKRKKMVDKTISEMAGETLAFIGSRKKFWMVQSSGMREEEKAQARELHEHTRTIIFMIPVSLIVQIFRKNRRKSADDDDNGDESVRKNDNMPGLIVPQ